MKLARKIASHCLESLCDQGMFKRYRDDDVDELEVVVQETLDGEGTVSDALAELHALDAEYIGFANGSHGHLRVKAAIKILEGR